MTVGRFIIVVLMALPWVNTAAAGAPARMVEVRKIWDRGEHNAFTDLIRWHGRWWCTFRESAATAAMPGSPGTKELCG